MSEGKGGRGSAVEDTLPLTGKTAALTTSAGPSHERYERTEKLGEGGMSWVFSARDRELDRTVAFKELRSPSPTAVARFLREARITARLQHPGIVPLYDVGRFPDGTPFYTMRQVSGRTLDDEIAGRATLAERLALLPSLIAVGEAIAYAHSRRVVHRDLKPLNVLIGAFGETLVIDWGIAKELTSDDDDLAPEALRPTGPGRTAVGQVLGTPAYMPPEQAEGRDIDERADVYALGAMLYALLAGTPPYDGPTWTGVLAQVKRAAPPPLAALCPEAPRALESIAARAMDRDPERRYRDAAALTEELKRFQAGQLVAAHDYTLGELAVRFLKRNRKLMALGVVSLVGFIVLGAFAVKNITNERNEADAQRSRAVAEARRAEQARIQAEGRRDELLLAQARALVDEDPTKALITLRQLPESAAGWREAQDVAVDALTAGVTERIFAEHRGPITGLALSPDGKILASVGADGTLRQWQLDGTLSRERRVGPGEATAVAYAPDGQQLATGSADGTVRLWSPGAGAGRDVGRHQGSVVAVLFHPSRPELITAGEDGKIRGWDLRGFAPREILTAAKPGHALSVVVTARGDLVYSNEGDAIYVAEDGRSEGRRIGVSDGEVLLQVAVAPGGTMVAAAGIDGSVFLVDLETSGVVRVGEHVGLVDGVVFSPDGRRLVSYGVDEALRFWDVSAAPLGAIASGQRLRGHQSRIGGAVFARDGRHLYSADHAGFVREWMTPPAPTVRMSDHVPGAEMPTIAFAGERVAVAGREGTVRLLPGERELRCTPPGRGNRIVGVTMAGEETTCATVTGLLTVFQDGRPIQSARAEQPPREMTFDEAGEVVAFPDGRTVRVLIPARGSSQLLLGPARPISAVALSRDGKRLAAAADREIWAWQVGDPAGRVIGAHPDVVFRVAFSPDGKLVASRGGDGKVRLWGAGAPRELDVGDGDWLAFSSDGALLAADAGEEIRVFLTSGGEPRLRPAHGVDHLDFLPGGHTVVYALRSGQVRLWDTDAGSVGGVVVPGVRHVVPAPDGMRFATSGVDSVARVWRVGDVAMVPAGAGALHRWVTGR